MTRGRLEAGMGKKSKKDGVDSKLDIDFKLWTLDKPRKSLRPLEDFKFPFLIFRF